MSYLFKYTGILAVVACLSLSGFIKSRLKRTEIARLKALEAAFVRADDMLTLCNKNREEILRECFFKATEGGDNGTRSIAPPAGAAKITDKFLKEFGSGDKDLEHNRITLAKSEISSLISCAEAQYTNLSKIWQTAGVCAGLALGIMLV